MKEEIIEKIKEIKNPYVLKLIKMYIEALEAETKKG